MSTASIRRVLHWSLGIILILESCLFALAPGETKAFAKSGLPQWLRIALGSAEALAAALFLAPRAMRIGGSLLLVIFFLAAAVHILHGMLNVGPLAIYAIAVLLFILDGDSSGWSWPAAQSLSRDCHLPPQVL